MRSEIQGLVDEMARCFAAGALASMVRPFSVPMPLYHNETGCWIVLKHHRDIAKFMSRKRVALGHRGCQDLRAITEQVSAASHQGTISARIRWLHLDPEGQPCIETRTTYFIRKDAQGLHIEMAEIEEEMALLSQPDPAP